MSETENPRGFGGFGRKPAFGVHQFVPPRNTVTPVEWLPTVHEVRAGYALSQREKGISA